MKTIRFTKMEGAGNDFVIIEGRPPLSPKKMAQRMCARETGLGADGLLILEKSKIADYRMRIINSDGSEAEMCGNGVRCLAAYIVREKKLKKKFFTIETLAGEILAEAKGETARVRLSAPQDYQPDITILINDQKIQIGYIDTGVPHTVIFVDGLNGIDVNSIGQAVRRHPQFAPRGANVNFVEQLSKNCVEVRTYERGVESETKACGTGSVASGIIGYLKSHPGISNIKKAAMKVKTQSGEVLDVTFQLKDKTISDVWLKGSAKFIAKGEYYYV